MTAIRQPTRQDVLACIDRDWSTTHAVFMRWLGDEERQLSRHGRDTLRAEVFAILDSLSLQGAVEKRQVDEAKAEWRRT